MNSIQSVKHNMARIFRLLRRGSLWFGLWFWLSGQKSSVDLEVFRFYSGDRGAIMLSKFYLFVAVVVVLVVGILSYFYWLYHIKRREDTGKITKDKANLQLDVILGHLKISETGHEWLLKVAKETVPSDDPQHLLPLVESVENFEKAVSVFKQKHQDAKSASQVFQLRQELGFEFANRKIPFVCTQMLSTGLKLECQVPNPKKKMTFMTLILDIGEHRLLIKPPTIKGQPANLKTFRQLHFRIRRNEDAEYEFTLPILNQLSGKLDAVVLGHTNKINKMFIREAERIFMELPTTFYLVQESQLEAEHEEELLENTETKIEAVIKDMSTGGLRIVTATPPDNLKAEDLLVFHLKGAVLRENLVVRVMRIVSQGGEHAIHLKFLAMKDITRMKINKFLHRVRKQTLEAEKPRTPAPEKAIPQPPDKTAPGPKKLNWPDRSGGFSPTEQTAPGPKKLNWPARGGGLPPKR